MLVLTFNGLILTTREASLEFVLAPLAFIYIRNIKARRAVKLAVFGKQRLAIVDRILTVLNSINYQIGRLAAFELLDVAHRTTKAVVAVHERSRQCLNQDLLRNYFYAGEEYEDNHNAADAASCLSWRFFIDRFSLDCFIFDF